MTSVLRQVVDSVRARVSGLLLFPVLTVRSTLSRRPATAPDGDLVVSLTTYGSRLRHVHLTVESIALGSLRPRRLILWLAPQDAQAELPVGLRRLQRRGLEVRTCEDLRSHKKYYPFTASMDSGVLVTADDDVYYPRGWLAGLERARATDASAVWCYRARAMTFEGDAIAPYAEWPLWVGNGPSPRMVPTGVSGLLHPPDLSAEIRARGTEFLRVAPAADDLWLHFLAVSRGIPIRQVGRRTQHFAVAPTAWRSGLLATNIRGGNDEVLQRLYPQHLRQRIARQPWPQEDRQP